MEGCWPVALISVGLPAFGAGFLLRTHAENWQWILLGWGLATLTLLSWLAGTDLVIPTLDEVDLFASISAAFTNVCGPLPFFISLVVSGFAGAIAADLSTSRGK